MKNRETFGLQTREMQLDTRQVSVEERTVDVAFSSDAPIERHFGDEVLGHAEGEIDWSRMNDQVNAPVLVNHMRDDHVGVVENARTDADGRNRATLRFGRGARASEIFQDVQDGIRTQISVGFLINRMVLEETQGDREVYRIVDWTPMEVSFASMAQDTTVGVGRSYGDDFKSHETVVEGLPSDGSRTMEEQKTAPASLTKETASGVTIREVPRDPTAEEIRQHTEGAREAETTRIRELNAIGKEYGEEKDILEAINGNESARDFKLRLLERKAQEERELPKTSAAPALGMPQREVQAFSIVKAVRAVLAKSWDGAGLEREVLVAAEKQYGISSRGFVIPPDVLFDPNFAKRETQKGGSGGNLVATDHLAGSFIELLRNRSLSGQLGVTYLPGLIGDVDIPRRISANAAAWVPESTGSGSTDSDYDKVTLTPKTLRARSDMSRKMLLQSAPAIEGLVRSDLVTVMGLENDRVIFAGSGTGEEPEGIVNTTGVSNPAWGSNAFDTAVDLETAVADDNADMGNLAYVTTPQLRGELKKSRTDAGSGIMTWTGGGSRDGFGELNGFRAAASKQVPANLGVGTNEHALIFGNFSDVLVGLWGVLDVQVDEFALADQGGLVMRTFQDTDVDFRHPESFAFSHKIPA